MPELSGPARRLIDRAWILLALAALFWAGNAIVARAVIGEVPPAGLAFWRWSLAAAVLLPAAWRPLARDFPELVRAWPIVLALSAFGVAAFNTLLYLAAQTTTALNIVLLQTAMPVLIVVFTYLLFRETVRSRQVVGLVLSIAGALTLVTRGELWVLRDLALNKGDAWMLAAVASYAAYTALLRKRPQVEGLSLAWTTFAVGALILLPLYIAETLFVQAMPVTATSALAIGYVVLFPSILSYLCFNRAVALVGPNTAGLAIYLVPVFGTALAVLLLGEIPSSYHGIGVALIAAGIALSSGFAGRWRAST